MIFLKYCAGTFIILFLLVCCDSNWKRTEEGLILTKEEVDNLSREDLSAAGSVVFTKGEFRGMKLFMKICNRCHPAGEKGKGPSLVDKKLPDFLIHFQVRQGLGDMPSFKEDKISKEDVKKIILFVRILRASAQQ